MKSLRKLTVLWAVGIASAACLWQPARGEEPGSNANWLAAAEETARDLAGPAGEPGRTWQKPGLWKAVSFTLDYTLASDYVWRGINRSEYCGEGREKPNHQLSVGFEIDPSQLGAPPIGRFGGAVWFEWYAGQERLTPWSGNNLQEVDYQVYWAYDVEPIALGVEVGWIAYHYPRLRDSGAPPPSDAAYTHEVYVKLSFDDSKVFGEPMLSPTVTYYHDVDEVQAGFLIAQISHDFPLRKSCGKAPILKDLTITPSFALAVDHRYYDKAHVGSQSPTVVSVPREELIVDEPLYFTAKGTRLAYLEYGLVVQYDLSGALGIPPECGACSVSGFLNFTQSLHDNSSAVQDEFWGGMSVGWEW
jgi:hypothetical protein